VELSGVQMAIVSALQVNLSIQEQPLLFAKCVKKEEDF
jgi:hypothetical protein